MVTLTSYKCFSQTQSAPTLQNTAVNLSRQQAVSIGLWASLAYEGYLHFGYLNAKWFTPLLNRKSHPVHTLLHRTTKVLETIIYTLSLCSYKAQTAEHRTLHSWTNLCRNKFGVSFIRKIRTAMNMRSSLLFKRS